MQRLFKRRETSAQHEQWRHAYNETVCSLPDEVLGHTHRLHFVPVSELRKLGSEVRQEMGDPSFKVILHKTSAHEGKGFTGHVCAYL